MELKLETINKILNDIQYPDYGSSGLVKVNSERTHTGVLNTNGYGSQDEFNETTTYYTHKELPEGVFVRFVNRTDSYGEGNALHSVQFVQGRAKQITVYEPI